MGNKTAIEWTDTTWNPVSGCTKVSQGCAHCYAERLFPRPYPGRKFTDVRTHPERLEQPLHWRKPRKVFVNSMSDLFHEAVPDEFIDQIFGIMALAEHHKFQILTKRPERMLAYMTGAMTSDGGVRIGEAAASLFRGMNLQDRKLSMFEQAGVGNKFEWRELSNVWLGVSVEDQKTADERIPLLLQTPAAIRFVSYEPALGPVDFTSVAGLHVLRSGGFRSSRIDWIIAGGESGPGARPAHPDWFRAARDQCQAAGVPFFFKQWGEWAPGLGLLSAAPSHRGVHKWSSERTAYSYLVDKKTAGRLLDGREWNEFPEGKP